MGGTVVAGTVVGGTVVVGTVADGGAVVVVGGIVVVADADRTVVGEWEVVVVEWSATGSGFVLPAAALITMAMTNRPRITATMSRTRFPRSLAGRRMDIGPPLVVPPLLA